MPLSQAEVKTLISMVESTCDDETPCAGCLSELVEFAEGELVGKANCEAAAVIREHLESCVDCSEEYELLLVALRELNESQDCVEAPLR